MSALHRNAHIWNASHSLLVNYYCKITVYSPSMEGKKKKSQTGVRLQGIEPGSRNNTNRRLPTTLFGQSYTMGCTESVNNDDQFKLQITTFAEKGKIQSTPKITNHLFTSYLNCMCKSNPVCLIQQWSVIFLFASYVQWLYFLVWAYENQPIDFSPSTFTLKRYAVRCFTSSNEWIDFCTTIQTDLLAYEFLRRSKSILKYKSKQPHAPLRSHKFGSSSIHLFPKSVVLLCSCQPKETQNMFSNGY